MWRGKGFPARGPLFGLLVTTVDQGCTSHISVSVLPSLKQNVMQEALFLQLAITKSRTALDTRKTKHTLRSNMEGYDYRTH
jgi:hypothetical protein